MTRSWASIALLLAACGASSTGTPTPSASIGPFAEPPPTTLASAPEPAPTPREKLSPTSEALDVPGYLQSLVVTPDQDDHPAPVVVVTHGAGGRPEPHCDRYLELTKGKAWLLCTRGRPTNIYLPEPERGYFYDGHIELGHEVDAALAALSARHGARVDLDHVFFAGFSQGASMGILFLQQGGAASARVQRILLVEGGSGEWTIGLAEKLRKEGVDRVAIVCGQRSCREKALHSARWITQAGLDVRSTYASGAGHTYDGAVRPLVDEAWAWLTEGDDRFAE